MGFNNPSLPWSELERRLSGRAPTAPPGADGGDSPAWSRRRGPYEAPPDLTPRSRPRPPTVPYAELHAHSNFSFLDGASSPEALAEEAARLGLEALALTDHDGFYGVVRFAEAAAEVGLPTVFGAEVTLDGPDHPVVGAPDPPGRHLVVLADGPAGYAALSRTLSLAQLAGEKGAPRLALDELVDQLGTGAVPFLLTGCRKGTVPRALEDEGPAAAARELGRLVEGFGRDRVWVELWDHGHPLDGPRNDALAELAVRAGVGVVATNNVHYATPLDRPLATALSAVRARCSLDELDGWLPAASLAHLRSGAEQRRRFARYPGAVEASVELARAAAFDLRLVAPGCHRSRAPTASTRWRSCGSWCTRARSTATAPVHAPPRLLPGFGDGFGRYRAETVPRTRWWGGGGGGGAAGVGAARPRAGDHRGSSGSPATS